MHTASFVLSKRTGLTVWALCAVEEEAYEAIKAQAQKTALQVEPLSDQLSEQSLSNAAPVKAARATMGFPMALATV